MADTNIVDKKEYLMTDGGAVKDKFQFFPK